MLNFIAKLFNEGEGADDESITMCGVSLIMACLEHLGQGMGELIDQINGFYLRAMELAESKDLKNMLVQGIMMNLWYEQNSTMQSLNARGCLE